MKRWVPSTQATQAPESTASVARHGGSKDTSNDAVNTPLTRKQATVDKLGPVFEERSQASNSPPCQETSVVKSPSSKKRRIESGKAADLPTSKKLRTQPGKDADSAIVAAWDLCQELQQAEDLDVYALRDLCMFAALHITQTADDWEGVAKAWLLEVG
jgi:hypothetical protein